MSVQEGSGIIDFDDPLPWPLPSTCTSSVHVYIELHLSPQQRYLHSLPEFLTAFTALLVGRQLDDVPALHNASAVQGLGSELTTLTRMAWVDMFRQRFMLRQQLQGDPLNRLQLAVRADSLACVADQIAATRLRDVPFGFTSTASPVGVAASFVSVLFLVAPQLSRPAFERLICVLSSLAASCIFQPCCSHFCHIAVFFLFTLPILHNSRTHIKVETLFTLWAEKKSVTVWSCAFIALFCRL